MTWICVWDPLVRLFHWSLVLSFGVAWFSANRWDELHIWAGYAAGGLIILRLIWGMMGTRYARFSEFVRPPSVVIDYLKAILKGRESRYVGHNPAGGAMIVALILTMASTAFSGWMLTTDALWGVAWAQQLHNLLADSIIFLVILHLIGVCTASFRHKENLILAMIHGRKRSIGAEKVE